VNKNVNKFYLCGSVAPTALTSVHSLAMFAVMQQRVYWPLFRNVDELRKWLVDVWIRTLSTLLSMNGERICVPLFAQRANISNIYC